MSDINKLFEKRKLSGIYLQMNKNISDDVNIKKVWITINRNCNFRCPWCYAESSGYSQNDDIDYEFAKDMIIFAKELGASTINLIGGEPLLYNKLFDLIEYIINTGLTCSIVTNGYMMANEEFLKKLKSVGLSSFGFSIKAGNEFSYLKQTGIKNSYQTISKAIHNIVKNNLNGGIYTAVITKDSIVELEEIADMVKIDKTRKLKLILCSPSFNENFAISDRYVLPMKDIVNKVEEIYPIINEKLEGRLVLQQSLPKCVWSEKFLNMLIERNQLSYGCHIYKKSGLIFDIDGNVILCNALSDFPIAKYKKDFHDIDSFKEIWNGIRLTNIINKIFELPNIKCKKCREYEKCFGGCPLKWFSYDANNII